MSQSTGSHKIAAQSPSRPNKVALLQRGSELAEFKTVLDDLGIPVVCFGAELPRIEELAEIRLILASTERLLDSGPPHLSNWPRTFAVIQDPSKTLSAHLGRIGVSMILCRPIHPQAIRLLLLHEVYRGPEKRIRGRTLIGQPVRLKAGLFSSKGTLLDLSPSGARIQMSGNPKVGARMRLLLGGELNGGKPLKLATQVVRSSRSKTPGKEKFSEVGLSILDAKQNQKAIASILQHFKFGPGRWSDFGGTAPIPGTQAANAEAPARANLPEPGEGQDAAGDSEAAQERARTLPPSVQRRSDETGIQGISVRAALAAPVPPEEPDSSAGGGDDTVELDRFFDADDAGPAQVEESERRGMLRVAYDRRIVALGEAAARVLVGQDLSRGGMRVLSRDGVEVGDLLKVALHCGTMMEPVVVSARAVREHGEDGMILNFEDLTASQVEHLEKIVSSSGPIRYMAEDEESHVTTDSEGPVVVGELLDRISAADEPNAAEAESTD